MRLILAFLFLPTLALAQIVPTGSHSWHDTSRNVNIRAWGPSNIPLNYQKQDSSWAAIDIDWQQINETTWVVENGPHQTVAYANGWMYFTIPRKGVRHTIGIRPRWIGKFQLSDSTWQPLATADYESVADSGSQLIYENIFYGIDVKATYFNSFFSQEWWFSQEARDSLAELGPWSGYHLATVSQLDADSLQLTLCDAVGETNWSRIVEWFQAKKNDTIVFKLPRSYLTSEWYDSSQVVRKRVVIYEGKPYLIELFNPVPVVDWPEGDVYHCATFGYEDSLTSALTISGIRRGLLDAPSSNGTADSATMYTWMAIAYPAYKSMALYEWGDTDSALVDTTEYLEDNSTSRKWVVYDFHNPPSISSSQKYLICGWASDPFGGGYAKVGYASGTSDDTLKWETMTYTLYNGGWAAQWKPASSGNYNIAAFVYYTESAAGQGKSQVITINQD